MAKFMHHTLTPPLTSPNCLNLSTTQLISPPKTTKFEPKTQSLKQICKQGRFIDAFHSFSTLFITQYLANFCLDEAYSSILELCASQNKLNQGKQIHAHLIISGGYCDLVFLRTKLVFMYGKCGAVFYAEKVFDEMPERSIFSWNAMIGAYVCNGMGSEAVKLYEEMRGLGVDLDACTFPCVLKACSMIEDLNLGAEVHGFVVKSGHFCNGIIVNAILSMYAKCGDITAVMRLFDRTTEREDVVLWNSVISAYSASGQPRKALMLFGEMKKANIVPSTYTFVSVLQACEDPSFSRLGMAVHGYIIKSSDHLDLYVANALLLMYARCGRMCEAAQIFDRVKEKDSVIWNSMLSSFVQNALYNEALGFFQEMHVSGEKPDMISVISILGACGRLQNLLKGMESHAYAIRNGFDTDLQVGNAILDMYAKCSYIKYMDCMFRKLPDRDLVSWTTIIAGYAQNSCYKTALNMFGEVLAQVMEVDAVMLGSVLSSCTELKRMKNTREIHGYILRRGLFNLALSNTLMDAYGRSGDIEYASRIFNLIEDKDIIMWTTMIGAYMDNGLGNEALNLFCSMQRNGVEPDSVALVSVLLASASLSALSKGKEIHGFVVRHGFVLDRHIASSIIDMYAGCGSISNAWKIFNFVHDNVKDVVLWTSMINASGMHGQGKAAVDLFNKMEIKEVDLDHVTFLALLYACSHSGLVDEGQEFLKSMKIKYKLQPWPEHYACVVDLLGRANRLEEAYQFVKSMPTEPNDVVWSALLRACHVHSNNKLGEIVLQELLRTSTNNPENYVLVSNVFASNGRWHDVERMRMAIWEKGLKKNPGCSWIEIRNKVHTFMAGDKSHPQADEIYIKLAQIIEILEKEGGYVAQTKYVLQNVKEEKKVRMLHRHSERLAMAYGLLETPEGSPIRITKNLRVCGDCHVFFKLVSKLFGREIVMRDASRFHRFFNGNCSCGDFW